MNDPLFKPTRCLLCDSSKYELVHIFECPIDSENTFGFSNYYRELWRCKNCGLFSNKHKHNLSQVYEGEYCEAAYYNNQMKSRFETIMRLPHEKSDNRQRVQRIASFMAKHYPDLNKEVLDIGCGMAVFPAAMRENGWAVTAIDPSQKNVEHAKKLVKVDAIQGTFPNVNLTKKFPLITFNKVIEHIEDIIECLSSARSHLLPNGVVYIELPDGETAIEAGTDRQEFFLEHYYIFSFASIIFLSARAGFQIQRLERVRDPSGKYTLFAFLIIDSNKNNRISPGAE